MIRLYILDDDRRVIRAADVVQWARWLENMGNRRVDFDVIGNKEVSTVFLGIDHRFGGRGPPLVFETMVFGVGDPMDGECNRYSSWDDAMTGHAATVRRLRSAVHEKKPPVETGGE
jgi:hypothetical protein